MARYIQFFLLLQVLHSIAGDGITVTRLVVPERVNRGTAVTLECEYDLNSQTLYSIKWYRDDREFFGFKPSQIPQKQVHHLPGIQIDMSMSTGPAIHLHAVDIDSGGQYKCEVISESPHYHTADRSADMVVVDIPEEKPTIEGTQHQYHIGDRANLVCISAKSKPPAELTWYINNNEAPEIYLDNLPSIGHDDGLTQTHLGLRFTVTRQQFKHGEMTLRCSARISSLYYKTQQHSVDGELTYHVPVMESRDSMAYSGVSEAPRRVLAAAFVTVLAVTHLTSIAS